MKKSSFSLSAQKGFSLVELLVVIAVIAIIAAIAIPNIAGITGAATVAKSQRNAQNLASTYNAAIAAGMPASANKAAAVDLIIAGTNVVIGNTTNFFRVDGLSADEESSAKGYIEDTLGGGGTLVYDAAGGNGTN